MFIFPYTGGLELDNEEILAAYSTEKLEIQMQVVKFRNSSNASGCFDDFLEVFWGETEIDMVKNGIRMYKI